MKQDLRFRDVDKTGMILYETCYTAKYPLKMVVTTQAAIDKELRLLFKYYKL